MFVPSDPVLGSLLAGTRLHHWYRIDFSDLRGEPPTDRLRLLEELCRGRTVLHLGFADHTHLVEERRRRGWWLHDRLGSTAKRCAGVDIDAGAVASAIALGVSDVHVADVLSAEPLPEPLSATDWDDLVLGEILEHCDNPVAWLRALVARTDLSWKRMIITVPNAFHARAFIDATRYAERVNTDHRYWFTPYTLMKVLARSDLRVEGLALAEYFPDKSRRMRDRVVKWTQRRYPLLRGCVIAVAIPADTC